MPPLFIYLFYRNYNDIYYSPTKQLMKDILKNARRSIMFIITQSMIACMVVGFIIAFTFSPEIDL
jgi:hypothetical protein